MSKCPPVSAAPPKARPLSPGLARQVYLVGRGRAIRRNAADGPNSKAQAQS